MTYRNCESISYGARVMPTAVLLTLMAFWVLPAQDQDNIRLPQLKFEQAGEYDTLAFKLATELARGTAGLMEREIDPATYILGPNDVLKLSIIASKPVDYAMRVSPEGKIMIPTIGVVDLRQRTLAEADSMVRIKARRIYKSAEVGLVLDRLRTFKVFVLGQVRTPATVEATAADRVSEVVDRVGGLLYNASLRRVLLYREGNEKAISVDLLPFYRYGDPSNNPMVQGGDRIFVQVEYDKKVLEIGGSVPYPGKYEFIEGDRLSTLIRFAGGFAPSAFLDSVEIGRFENDRGQIRRWFTDLSSWQDRLFSEGDLEGDFPLREGDRVNIRFKPDWLSSEIVVVEGEVTFPGKYPISRGRVRLRDIIERAGGFTPQASLEGAVMFRNRDVGEVDKEFVRLSKLDPSEMSEDELKYFRARAREVDGLMAVDFRLLYDEQQEDNNVLVQGLDSIYVPQEKNYINIMGRVNSPGRVVFKPNLTYLDYIQLAGGFGYRANPDETLVVKSKGEQFLASDFNYTLEPGDRIMVAEQPDTKFIDVFSDALTITTQLFTIAAVVISVIR